MALSESDKDYIAASLGYPVHPDTDSLFSEAFDRIDASPPALFRVQALVSGLQSIQSQVTTARNTLGSPYDQLLVEAQRLNYQLSNTLGVEVRQKIGGPVYLP